MRQALSNSGENDGKGEDLRRWEEGEEEENEITKLMQRDYEVEDPWSRGNRLRTGGDYTGR